MLYLDIHKCLVSEIEPLSIVQESSEEKLLNTTRSLTRCIHNILYIIIISFCKLTSYFLDATLVFLLMAHSLTNLIDLLCMWIDAQRVVV